MQRIKQALQNKVTDVYYALSAHDGIEQLAKDQLCLVIMDILQSETDGLRLLKVGAHVYLENPYDLEECLAHAQSLMELYMQLHIAESGCYTLAFGMNLIIDPVKHQATLKGEPMNLTRKEFDMLFYLVNHTG